VSREVLGYSIAVAIELAGIFVTLVGIAVELSTGAELGHNVISLGSAIVALGSVIWAKIYRPRRKNNKG
jgi:hypothetical protein